MKRLVLRRGATLIPTALLASTLVFFMIRLIPGGPAAAFLGQSGAVTPEGMKIVNARLGLDHPIYEQYGIWVGHLFRGDLGNSLQTGYAVEPQLWRRLPVSLELVSLAIFFTVVVAVPVGVISAYKAQTKVDGALRNASGLALSVPNFVVAIGLIAIFGARLHWFPELGWASLVSNPWQNLRHILLPATALALGASAIIVRQVRSAMIDALASPYVRTARAMGLREREIVWNWALRNALPTVLNVYAVLIIGLLGSTVIIEQIFVVPGLGSAVIAAINSLDYNMLQGEVIFFVVIVLLVNLAVDVLSGLLDPRLRG